MEIILTLMVNAKIALFLIALNVLQMENVQFAMMDTLMFNH